MFGVKPQEYIIKRQKRLQREKQISNRLYIFEYSPDKVKNQKHTEIDLTDTKSPKSAAYLLKKEQLRLKRKQLDGVQENSAPNSNVERLKSLIKNSRVFVKTSDSGVQKLTRSLQKLLKTNSNIRGAFDSLKRQTMVSSSHNMELFIQSRHNEMRQTVKVKQKEEELLQINQHHDQMGLNGDGSNYFKDVSKQLGISKDQKIDSFSFQNIDTPIQKKHISRGNITTQQELSFSGQYSPASKNIIEQIEKANIAKPIKLNFYKTDFPGSLMEAQMYSATFQIQSKITEVKECDRDEINQELQTVNVESESDEIQLLFSQVAFLFTKKVSDSSAKKRPIKPSSPIFNLLDEMPSNNNPSVEYHPLKKSSQISQLQQNSTKKSSKIVKRDPKKQKIATNIEYANNILFGQVKPEKKPQQKSIRNPLMQEALPRRRAFSMPKITFTYTSRDKFQREASPQMKKSIFPITTYKKSPKRETRDKSRSNKNTIKDELQTTVSSKQNPSSRVNPKFVNMNDHNPYYNMDRSPVTFQRVMVSPKQHIGKVTSSGQPINNQGCPVSSTNDYYGNYTNLRKFDQQQNHFEKSRERVITAHPNMIKNVDFQDQEPHIFGCCMRKETRSRSLNDRMLLVHHQNLYQA